MKKLSQKEGIAVAISIILVLAFLSAYSVLFSSGGNGSGFLSSEDARGVRDIQQALDEVRIEDFIIGNGPAAQQGDTLFVHYVGQLEDGTTFDTSVNQSDPFLLSLGAGQVISGWDLGLIGMREGGTRRLVVPPALAYGDKEIVASNGQVIVPSNSTLVFDVVLLKVESSF